MLIFPPFTIPTQITYYYKWLNNSGDFSFLSIVWCLKTVIQVVKLNWHQTNDEPGELKSILTTNIHISITSFFLSWLALFFFSFSNLFDLFAASSCRFVILKWHLLRRHLCYLWSIILIKRKTIFPYNSNTNIYPAMSHSTIQIQVYR
jgi:hypothetical protein